MTAKREVPLTLGIQRIEPVNLDDPTVLSALEQTRRALSNPNLQRYLEIRTAIQNFLCNELISCGYVHPPIYMLAGCTDPLNHWTYPARINYYGEEVSLTQSLILQKILMVMLSGVGQVFWASPNIRMEMRIGRKDYKYVTEFMQVDFEKRDGTYEEMISFLGSMVQRLYRFLNERFANPLQAIRGSLLPALEKPLSIYNAQQVREQQGFDNDDAVEKWASQQEVDKPFFVVNLKREAYDRYDPNSGRYLNYDVVVPPFGENPYPVECLSGAERTRSVHDLQQRMAELRYPAAYFAPFFELFASLDDNAGQIRCAGAGFGVERLTYALLGLKDIHEVYPFPRMAEAKIAL